MISSKKIVILLNGSGYPFAKAMSLTVIRKNTIPTQPQLTIIFVFFPRKPGKSVDQSEHAIYNTKISKQKQMTALHQGWQWAFNTKRFCDLFWGEGRGGGLMTNTKTISRKNKNKFSFSFNSRQMASQESHVAQNRYLDR